MCVVGDECGVVCECVCEKCLGWWMSVGVWDDDDVVRGVNVCGGYFGVFGVKI